MRLKDLNLNYYVIGFVLKKENSDNFILLLYNDNEESSSFIIETDGINYTMNEIQVWDFNLDEYLFEYLENGYDIFIIDYKHILYIDLYINYNLDDIEYIDGLSKYIEYKEKELQDERY
ncbi:MAG: hypothetical protein MR695_06040 [Solobacterium sp.]|nr:hypothetical protein [Solobacterium sp.]